MNVFDQDLLRRMLLEIDNQTREGVSPVDDRRLAHLCEEGEILDYLVYLKNEGLISANVIKKGAGGALHKMVNIRLTYLGMRILRSS